MAINQSYPLAKMIAAITAQDSSYASKWRRARAGQAERLVGSR